MANFNIKLLKSNLKALRKISGASITEIAYGCGFTRESIYRWEDIKDSRCPSIGALITLCNRYDIDIQSILFDDISLKIKELGIQSAKKHPEDQSEIIQNIFSISKSLGSFFLDLKESMNSLNGYINEVYIDEISMVSPSYIAFKINKEHNNLQKQLHFLTIFPNLKRKNIRLVFSASLNELYKSKSDANNPLSESAFSQLAYSPMGATLTVAIIPKTIGVSDKDIIDELVIKENHSLKPNINDIVELSAKTLEIVISKKK